MKSKTKIEKQSQRKTNSLLVETITAAKKKEGWLPVARILSGPRRRRTSLNLVQIQDLTKDVKDGETIVIPGKILSYGELEKKIKLVALSFSERAKEKLEKRKISATSMIDEIKKNPEAKNIKIMGAGKK